MKIAARAAIALLVLAYGAMLVRHLSWAAGGADSSGYLNESRMIRRGQTALPIRMLSRLRVDRSWADVFTPLGFVPWGKDARFMVPTYPPGLPLHFAIAGAIGGFKRAPFLIPPLAAIVSLILMMILGRQLGLTWPESVAGAAILAACAVFLLYSAQPMSDGVATMWTLAAIVAALRGGQAILPARTDRIVCPPLAGFCFAISVVVRPSNILIALPLAVALRFRWRPLLLAAAAALPIGIALMLWNHTLYRSYFSTGYGSMRDMLAWSYVQQRLPHYSLWLGAQLTPLVFPFGLIADRKNRALLLAWFLPLFVFYCFYEAYDAWWYTRFLLPAIPALVIGFILLIRRLRYWPVLAAIVLVFAIVQDWRLHPLAVGEEESLYTETMGWVAPRLPPNAIVCAMQFSGTFLYYFDRDVVRYDKLDANRFQELRAYAGAANLRWYAVLQQWELEQFHLPGKWTPVARNRDVTLLRLDD